MSMISQIKTSKISTKLKKGEAIELYKFPAGITIKDIEGSHYDPIRDELILSFVVTELSLLKNEEERDLE